MRAFSDDGSRSLRLTAAALVAGAALLAGAGSAFAQGHDAGPGSAGATGASAHGSGDSNAGDVWTDTVGQPSGPGHEQDPHLPCADINLWGAGLADSSGTYTIDGWPPSGSQEQDYASTWAYDAGSGGSQVISVISYQKLIATAVANGDTAAHQGYHFKLQFSQDPQKHKTFWIDCPAPATGSGATTSPGGGTTPVTGNGVGGVTTPVAAPTVAPSSENAAGPTVAPSASSPTPAAGLVPVPAAQAPGGVLGISTSTPATGAAIAAGLAILLIVLGSLAVLVSRRGACRTS